MLLNRMVGSPDGSSVGVQKKSARPVVWIKTSHFTIVCTPTSMVDLWGGRQMVSSFLVNRGQDICLKALANYGVSHVPVVRPLYTALAWSSLFDQRGQASTD